jgi:hypothetical protein
MSLPSGPFRPPGFGRGGPSCLQAQLPLNQPQLRRPVRQRQAQPLHVRVAGAEGSLDFRNLPAATCDSYGPLPAFLSDLIECAPVAI